MVTGERKLNLSFLIAIFRWHPANIGVRFQRLVLVSRPFLWSLAKSQLIDEQQLQCLLCKYFLPSH
jgi:hypothetical protein